MKISKVAMKVNMSYENIFNQKSTTICPIKKRKGKQSQIDTSLIKAKKNEQTSFESKILDISKLNINKRINNGSKGKNASFYSINLNSDILKIEKVEKLISDLLNTKSNDIQNRLIIICEKIFEKINPDYITNIERKMTKLNNKVSDLLKENKEIKECLKKVGNIISKFNSLNFVSNCLERNENNISDINNDLRNCHAQKWFSFNDKVENEENNKKIETPKENKKENSKETNISKNINNEEINQILRNFKHKRSKTEQSLYDTPCFAQKQKSKSLKIIDDKIGTDINEKFNFTFHA